MDLMEITEKERLSPEESAHQYASSERVRLASRVWGTIPHTPSVWYSKG
jgi:hypothetical protein